MNLKSLVRDARMLALAGAVAFAFGVGFHYAHKNTQAGPQTAAIKAQVQVADGSESGGKPPKPKS